MTGQKRIHDRELLDALEGIKPEQFSGTAWRCSWASRDPLTGSTNGGRWHPPNFIEGLYTSLESDGALAEIHYHLTRYPVFSSSNVKLHELKISKLHVLRLGSDRLSALGVKEPLRHPDNRDGTQEIGAAAFFLEYQGIIVPSARRDCLNLLVFVDRTVIAKQISVARTLDVNWPAWQAQQDFGVAK